MCMSHQAAAPIVPCPCTLSGNATEALERSRKRQRSLAPAESSLDASFCLDQIFNAIPISTEKDNFPSISWPVDPMPVRTAPPSTPSSRKRSRDGLSRCKAFQQGLDTLNSEATNVRLPADRQPHKMSSTIPSAVKEIHPRSSLVPKWRSIKNFKALNDDLLEVTRRTQCT